MLRDMTYRFQGERLDLDQISGWVHRWSGTDRHIRDATRTARGGILIKIKVGEKERRQDRARRAKESQMKVRAVLPDDRANASAVAPIQHLIDPELCIQCYSCVARCPWQAIVDEGPVLAVNPDRCVGCGTCAAECPTGAIDQWFPVSPGGFHSVEEQQSWRRLPS